MRVIAPLRQDVCKRLAGLSNDILSFSVARMLTTIKTDEWNSLKLSQSSRSLAQIAKNHQNMKGGFNAILKSVQTENKMSKFSIDYHKNKTDVWVRII
jgi:hypothetical protein